MKVQLLATALLPLISLPTAAGEIRLYCGPGKNSDGVELNRHYIINTDLDAATIEDINGATSAPMTVTPTHVILDWGGVFTQSIDRSTLVLTDSLPGGEPRQCEEVEPSVRRRF